MDKEFKDDTSAFNQFMPYIETLTQISRALDDASLTKNYSEKYQLLRRLYIKLHPLVKDPKDLDNMDTWLLKAEDCNKQLMHAKQNNTNTIPLEVVEVFDTWEIELMDLWHKKIPFCPAKSDPRYAMMGSNY